MQREVIRFDRGTILRKEMLEKLYDFPQDVLNCFYYEYGDGILFGLKYVENDGKHYILPGAIKYNGDVFFQKSAICMEDDYKDEAMEDTEYFLYFKEQPVVQNNSVEKYELSLSLEKEEIKEGFCYRKLRFQMGEFNEVCNRPNTNEQVYGLFASKDEYGFRIPCHRLVLELEDVLREKRIHKNYMDYQLIDKMQEFESISVIFLNNYIAEYNYSRKDEEDNLLQITTNDSAIDVINKVKHAIEKNVLVYKTSSEEKTTQVPAGKTKKDSLLWD